MDISTALPFEKHYNAVSFNPHTVAAVRNSCLLSDWTRRCQIDGVKHDALALEHV